MIEKVSLCCQISNYLYSFTFPIMGYVVYLNKDSNFYVACKITHLSQRYLIVKHERARNMCSCMAPTNWFITLNCQLLSEVHIYG